MESCTRLRMRGRPRARIVRFAVRQSGKSRRYLAGRKRKYARSGTRDRAERSFRRRGRWWTRTRGWHANREERYDLRKLSGIPDRRSGAEMELDLCNGLVGE